MKYKDLKANTVYYLEKQNALIVITSVTELTKDSVCIFYFDEFTAKCASKFTVAYVGVDVSQDFVKIGKF